MAVRRADWMLLLGLTAMALALRLPYVADHPQGWDAIDFALALDRYDLTAMQPHFPGYPVYIWAGRLARRWLADPFAALAAVSALAGALSGGWSFWLARSLFGYLFTSPAVLDTDQIARIVPIAPTAPSDHSVPTVHAVPTTRTAAAIAAAWVALSPLTWLTAEQAMSDSLGLSFFLLTLLAAWYWQVALPGRASVLRAALAGLGLGLTLGVRLSYFPLGLTLLAVWAMRRFPLREAAAAGLGLMVGTGPWLAWQEAQEGMQRFVQLALGFTAGHLTDWGGAVVAGETGNRWLKVFGRNWLGLGLGGPLMDGVFTGGPAGGAVIALVLALVVTLTVGLGLAGWLPVLTAGGGGTTPRPQRAAAGFLAAWLLPYLLWAYLGQNPANPRHILPLVPWAVVATVGGWLGWFHRAASPSLRLQRGIIALLVAAAVLLRGWQAGWPLVREHHQQPPPMVMLARYLRDQLPARGPCSLPGKRSGQ